MKAEPSKIFRNRQYFRGDIVDRFWSKVRVGDNCWEWMGSRKPIGYGQFNMEKVNGKSRIRNAHKIAWEMLRGSVGQLHVLHKCDNKVCVRPNHLYLGTERDNSLDRYHPERWMEYK